MEFIREELNIKNFDKDLEWDINPEAYNISSTLCYPFINEIKRLLKRVKNYRYMEDPVTKKIDHIRTRSIVIMDGIESFETKEKYPVITVGRSAMQFGRSNINNMPNNSMLGDKEYRFGQYSNSNINIKVECKTQSDVERLASLITFYLRINAVKMKTMYGFTDIDLNYLSQPNPVKGGNDEKVDAWQIGINVALRMDENFLVRDGKEEIQSIWELKESGVEVEGFYEAYEK